MFVASEASPLIVTIDRRAWVGIIAMERTGELPPIDFGMGRITANNTHHIDPCCYLTNVSHTMSSSLLLSLIDDYADCTSKVRHNFIRGKLAAYLVQDM